MSCINVKLTRVGGMEAKMDRKGGAKVRMALVCGEIEMISALADHDGNFLLTVDGNYILVRRQRQ